MNEMQKNYNNGRVDISLLIEAMNKYFSSRVQHIRSVGDYYIALNEWAAQKDELIKDAEESQ
jgi:outer membrane protein TolC